MKSGCTMIPVITVSLLISLCTCSINNLSGVETTNGKVIGTLFNLNGSTAEHVAVCLIPAHYNPVKDSGSHKYLTDTTDNNGMYTFIVQNYGEYNLQAAHKYEITRVLNTGIIVGNNTIVVNDTLHEPGAIKIILPDTVDTNRGFIFIRGTTIYRNFKSNVITGPGGKKHLILDSVPAASSLNLFYGEHTDTNTLLLSNTLKVTSNQVTEIIITNLTIKPTWNIRILAGVTAQTLQYYNNDMDSLKKLIDEQVAYISHNFNDSGIFSGIFNFYVDSVYSFSTSPVTAEFKKPPAGYAFRLIYDGYGSASNGGFYPDYLTSYHVENFSTGGKLFGDQASDQATWNFGLAKGGVSLSIIGVSASKNPVNHQDYIVEESMMNNARVTKKWDSLHIHIFNHYKDSGAITRSIVHDAFPADMGITAESGTGVPLPNVLINLFRVEWAQYSVFEPPVFSDSTDSTGEVAFTQNPFKPDTSSTIKYPNFLIQAINGTDTVYAWLPMTEVCNAWFKDQTVVFRKKITF